MISPAKINRLPICTKRCRRANEATSTLETLQASAPVGLGFVDLDFCLTHLNKQLASFTGSQVKDLVGKRVSEVVPDIWTQIGPIFHRVLNTGEAVRNIEVSGRVGQ